MHLLYQISVFEELLYLLFTRLISRQGFKGKLAEEP